MRAFDTSPTRWPARPRAGARGRPSPATRRAAPGRRRPCRSRARGSWWRRSRAGARPSAPPRSRGAGPARGCRGGRGRSRLPPARSGAAQSRSQRPRLFTNTIVERCASTSASSSASMAGHMPRAGSGSSRAASSPSSEPERPVSRAARGPGRRGPRHRTRHVRDGHAELEIEAGPRAGVDDRHRPVAAEEARHLGQGSRGRREADALGIPRRERRQALEGEREVGAALGRRQGVDLVDDHRLDAAQRLALPGAEDQVERLGGRDQDLGGVARLGAALPRRRVAGAQRHPRRARSEPEALRGAPDPDEGRAQVALDVGDERLQRRDVEDADARRLLGPASGSGGRCTRGRPRGSCRFPSARGAARARRRRSAPSRAPARASAARSSPRTRRGRRDRTRPRPESSPPGERAADAHAPAARTASAHQGAARKRRLARRVEAAHLVVAGADGQEGEIERHGVGVGGGALDDGSGGPSAPPPS